MSSNSPEDRLLARLTAAAESRDDAAANLSDKERSVLREALVRHEVMMMRGFKTGRVYAGFIRLLMNFRDGVEARIDAGRAGFKPLYGPANVIAYGFRTMPRIILPRLEKLLVRWFPGTRPERRLRSALYGRGMDPALLLHLVDKLPQQSDCYAYHHDRSRNIVFGTLVGVDLLPHDSRWAVVEANTGSGQDDQWKLRKTANPFIDNMLDFAKANGFQNIRVINNDRGLHESQERFYAAASGRTGVNVEVIEPSSVPFTRHPRSSIVPPLDRPDTLCVRIREFPSLADFVLSDKRYVQETLQSYFAAHKVAIVFVPDTAPGWMDRMHWESGAYPNIVSKIPDADKGIGIAFYKAKGKTHALELIERQGTADFKVGGLGAALSRSAKSGERMLQPFVRSDLSADGCLQKLRFNLLVTPVGSKLLSVTNVIAAKPVPESLNHGVVEDPYPFLVNVLEGAKRRVPAESEFTEFEPVANVLAAAITNNLERQFEFRTGG